MPRALHLSLLLVVLLTTGCRFGVAAELTIARDGSATAEVLLGLDPAALDELDGLGVDPTAELAATAAQVPEWQVTRTTEEDGALTVRLTHDAGDAADAADALRELAAGLAPRDPALLVDLDLVVDADAAVQLQGTAELRPPATPGATIDGEPVGPDAAVLERLTAEAVTASLSVTPPGPLLEHDADRVDGRTLTWELVPGEPRSVHAAAAAPGGLPGRLLAAVAVSLLLLASGLLVWWWRRRP